MAGMKKRMDDELEFPPLEDLGVDPFDREFGPDFFGLGQMVTADMLRSAVVSSLSGAGGIVATVNILDRIDALSGRPNTKAAIAIGTGVVVGRLIWTVSRDAALGFMGGVAGMGLANLVGNMADVPSSLGAAEVTTVPPDQFWSRTRGTTFRGSPQLRQPIVTEEDPFATMGAAEVTEDKLDLSSWIS